MTRKQQAIRGHVTPLPHQRMTIKQIPKAEWDATRPTESWWTAYATPAPRTADFYAEATRRHAVRVNVAEKRASRDRQPTDPPPPVTVCIVETCQKPLTANDQRHRVIRCRGCRRVTPRTRRAA